MAVAADRYLGRRITRYATAASAPTGWPWRGRPAAAVSALSISSDVDGHGDADRRRSRTGRPGILIDWLGAPLRVLLVGLDQRRPGLWRLSAATPPTKLGLTRKMRIRWMGRELDPRHHRRLQHFR